MLFVIAVCVFAVAPRMPFDAPWTIGGNLSKSFRKTLLFLVSCYVVRNLVLVHVSKSVFVFVHGLEGVIMSFLSLLTPYLLRVWMRDRINVPGGRQPGKALMPWVQLFAVLTFIGVILRISTGSHTYWISKKIADAISFIPVMHTLKLYNSLTSPCGSVRYPGR